MTQDKKPLLSIIIPVYNQEQYVGKCLKSICQQSFNDYEIIVINDGSQDNSRGIIRNIAEKNERIKVIDTTNTGVSSARNKGVKAASGVYYIFIDSDDWIDQDYLSHLTNEMSKEDADLIVSGITHEFPNKKSDVYKFSSRQVIKMEDSFANFFIDHIGLFYGPHTKIYKASIIHDNNVLFPLDYSLGEDLLFNFEYLNYVKKITCIPYVGYHYRRHNGDSLTNRNREDLFEIKLYQWRKQKSFLESKGMWNNHANKHFYLNLWGIVYDGIFLFPKLNHLSSTYIEKILSIPEIDGLKHYKTFFKCSWWIKWMILHRNAYAIYLLFKYIKGGQKINN